jgi:hypothetical protein
VKTLPDVGQITVRARELPLPEPIGQGQLPGTVEEVEG